MWEAIWKVTKETFPLFLIGLLLASSGFLLCCSTVDYKEYTGIQKCDIAIMMGKIKSKKGYEAFEISTYINGCYAEIDRIACKQESFKNAPVSYDNKDERYINYIQCLKDRK